jgi:hypothetical protein
MIDIGFGDAVEPGLAELDLPVMLDFSTPPDALTPAFATDVTKVQQWNACGGCGV